ncbi:N-6 DNA methylase [Clostridiaceae bacterium UIB06]|uniref:site-specific DNA-methyltransferase (adenine-specific) n=1 Tax=Clostridium thailandense TaxID=2794346 RepID=A0A949WQP1_9CLOT|nr:N-6 DNA methylase [Clostridium thailandense]MBV7273005.1 N-6 DNA methylase [Clostridium thailandense]MCH5135669.1 N-6 DNA methylase [Clostridiaceae bacterium UIB06]
MNAIGSTYEKLKDKNIRKSMGIFYTPDYIVDYILKYTVSEADVLENPFVKVLDPTCGAGYFLIKAYNILKKKFLDNLDELRIKYKNCIYYMENKKSFSNNLEKTMGKDYWVEKNIDYHIIKNCLYGVDLDPSAVELTKKNLLGVCKNKIEIDVNIIEGDSLIKWEKLNSNDELNSIIYKDSSDIKIIDKKISKLRKLWDNQFDYIVGNPPYVMLLQSEIEKDYWDYIVNNYKTVGYKKNTFYLLMERVLEKLKYGGKHGFIIPDRYFLASSYAESRRNLVSNFKILNITRFSEQIFEDAIVGTVIYIIERSTYIDNDIVQLKLEYINEDNFYSSCIKQRYISEDKKFTVNILTRNEYQGVIKKIKSNSKSLKEFCDVHVGMMVKNKGYYLNKYKDNSMTDKIVLGRDLDEYIIDNDNRCFCINDIEIFGGTRDVKKHNLYPKILLRKTGNNLVAAIDEKGFFAEQSVYLVIPCSSYKVYNLLGQIQSTLNNFYFKEALITNPKAYPYIQHYDVEQLPINLSLMHDEEYEKLIKNIVDIKEKIKFLKLSFTVKNKGYDEILHSYKEFKDRKVNLNLELKASIKMSNRILYSSYKLTKEEIVLIESAINEKLLTKKNSNCRINEEYTELLDEAFDILRLEVIKLLEDSKKYLSIRDIEKGLENEMENFYDVIKIIENYKYKRCSENIIRNVLNLNSITWNMYISNKSKKELIKYSKNEYGLTSWTEKIHRIWFLDNKKAP